MSKLVFTQELAQKYYDSEEDFPMPLDAAWQYAGYSTKGNAKQALKSSGLIENIDWVFMIDHKNTLHESQVGRPSETIYLSLDAFKHFGMMAGTEEGKKIRMYFIECEKSLRKLLSQRKNEIEAVSLSNSIQTDIKRLEQLSQPLADVLRQRLLGNTTQLINPALLKQQDSVSLFTNRMGLAFNKYLKAFDTLQDTYSPEAYTKLKDLYQQLAKEHNELLVTQSGTCDQQYEQLKEKYNALALKNLQLTGQKLTDAESISTLKLELEVAEHTTRLLQQENERLKREIDVLTNNQTTTKKQLNPGK